jgi:predicted aldo/keto reductase-like oxidoreductase
MDYYDWGMCQIQQNLLDIKNDATEKAIALAEKKGCACVIMEPLRGGGLGRAPESAQKIYDEYPVKRSAVEWAFRHLLDYSGVSNILSGMSSLEDIKENIEIFSKPDIEPGCLTAEEKDIIARVRAAYEAIETIPCTACEYCMPCPNGVNIPSAFMKYNDGMRFGDFIYPRRSYYFQTMGGGGADKCIQCGVCTPKCPQNIAIPEELAKAHEQLKGWIE